jgi:hypothetical protein
MQFLKTAIYFVAAIGLFGSIGYYSSQGGVSDHAIEVSEDDAQVLSVPFVQDFELRSFDDKGYITHIISGDELRVRPRRFMFFNMNSFKELYVADGEIDLYLANDAAQPDQDLLNIDSSDNNKNKLHLPESYGRITRILVEGLLARIYEDKKMKVVIHARQGVMRKTGKKPELKWVKITHRDSQQQLITKRVLWDKGAREFLVPGSYKLQNKEEIQHGKNVKVNLDFVIVPM